MGALRVGRTAPRRRAHRALRASGDNSRPGKRHARDRRRASRGSRPAIAIAGARVAIRIWQDDSGSHPNRSHVFGTRRVRPETGDAMTVGRVLVTGATGFVGSGIVRALTSAGNPVRVLVRASSPRTNLAGLEVETVSGDICDADAVARAMVGVRYVVHAAADYRLWVRDPA